MASFPTSVISPVDPLNTDKLNNPSHSAQHQSHNAEIVAIESKVGTGSSTPSTDTFLIGNGSGTSAWSSLTSAQLRARISDETGTGVAVFATTPTLVTPVLGAATGTSLALGGGTALTTTNQTGTGNLVLASSPTLTSPRITTSINDTNGNEVIVTPATASAVNEVTITNATTGGSPTIAASGSDATANLNLRGKGLAKTVTIGAGATTIFPYDYVVSGCIWSGDSYGGTLAASMTSGVVVINGSPITVATVTARAFTTNVDTYIDVLDAGDGTGTVVYTTAATNAASAALAANSIRIGIIQAAATITAATKVNQGQEDRVFPIVSSVPYAVTDSLGNLICPRDPNRKILGYRQTLANQGSITAEVVLTGLTVPVIIPTARKFKVTVYLPAFSINSNNAGLFLTIRNGTTTGGTQLQSANVFMPVTGTGNAATSTAFGPGITGSQSFVATASTSTGTGTSSVSTTQPGYMVIELA